jgi:hypothetical protein
MASMHVCGNGMGAIAVWILELEHVHADLRQEEITGIFDVPVNEIR